MGLYNDWRQMCEMAQTPQQQNAFWSEYFALETKNYEKILSDTSVLYEGTVSELADQFGMDDVVFAGFIDGINTSLKKEINLDKLTSSSKVKLDIDLEKLYFNMLDAKAKWLYELPQWDDIFSVEKRNEIRKEWRSSKQAVSDKTVGRNDPCPCGSGKKYKKCCGAGK